MHQETDGGPWGCLLIPQGRTIGAEPGHANGELRRAAPRIATSGSVLSARVMQFAGVVIVLAAPRAIRSV